MARKRDLASKLTQQGETQTSRPGWRDAITGPAQADAPPRERADEDEVEGRRTGRRKRRSAIQRKTYLLTPELVDHVATLAEEERVGINELVRFLLRSSLDMVESGELEIPTRPAKRQIVREQ